MLRALLVSLPVVALTLCLYWESGKSERLLVAADTARQADNAATRLHAFLQGRLSALRAIGNFSASSDPPPTQPEYRQFINHTLVDMQGFFVIAWYAADGAPGPILPTTRPTTSVDVSVPATAALQERAIATRRPACSAVFEIEPGEPAVTIAAPLYRGRRYGGIAIGTVRLDEALAGLYSTELHGVWNVDVFDEKGAQIYQSASSPLDNATERNISIADHAWRLRLWPTPKMIGSLRTSAPQRILALGFLAATIVGIANFLLARRQERLGESLRISKQLSSDLAVAQRHLNETVNGIEAVVWESDLKMKRFTFFNDYGRKLLGIDALEWTPEPGFWIRHVHSEDRERAMANSRTSLEPGRTYPEEYRMLTADGKTLWVREMVTAVLDGGVVQGRRGVIVDITARVQAEEALRQSQKLESLGVLAGGIAHDFNNLLTTILGNAEMLGQNLTGAPAAAANHLEKIERTTRRLAELTRQMLAYSGRGKFTVAELDLNAIIAEMTDLLSVSATKNVEVTYHLDPRLPTVEGDASQMRQVVLNLLTNAAEAIGDQTHGEVTIRTAECLLTAEESAENYATQELPAGRYAQLEVSDTGCGMNQETLLKIFDPFFTTKFTGRGLGLAALRGIIRSHRGGIRIFSQPGEGTVFTIIFPVSAQPAARQFEQPARHRTEGAVRGARLQALVVDDEEGLRSLMADALRKAGFDVLEAADGLQGVAQFRRRAHEIDVVILDLTMPRLNGDEALAQMTAFRPDVCVILCSGFTKEEVDRQFTGRRLAGFIEKPFTPSELVAKIRAVLAERETAHRSWPHDERRFSLGDAASGTV